MITIKQDSRITKRISAFELRKKCYCAGCVDEISGRVLIEENKLDKKVAPLSIK